MVVIRVHVVFLMDPFVGHIHIHTYYILLSSGDLLGGGGVVLVVWVCSRTVMCVSLMMRAFLLLPRSCLMLLLAVHIVQEAVFRQPVVVVAVNVDGRMLLGGLVIARVCEPGQQRIVLELGCQQEVGVLQRE